jgi:SAM-dependent methyltransferase
MNAFSSASYWETRYRTGGNSGAGSYGRLAGFKAAFINAFIADNRVTSVIDLGCGDGNLLSMLHAPGYTGVDVSATTLARCAARFPDHRFVPFHALNTVPPADLVLSIDVIFHLIEDAAFTGYMRALFAQADRFVLIYASNLDRSWPSPHVRHRRFSDHVAATQPGWRLLAHVPNRYPFDPARPDETSFADFYVYARAAAGALVRIPDES